MKLTIIENRNQVVFQVLSQVMSQVKSIIKVQVNETK